MINLGVYLGQKNKKSGTTRFQNLDFLVKLIINIVLKCVEI